jgi:hypothetical protein
MWFGFNDKISLLILTVYHHSCWLTNEPTKRSINRQRHWGAYGFGWVNSNFIIFAHCSLFLPTLKDRLLTWLGKLKRGSVAHGWPTPYFPLSIICPPAGWAYSPAVKLLGWLGPAQIAHLQSHFKANKIDIFIHDCFVYLTNGSQLEETDRECNWCSQKLGYTSCVFH